MQIAHKINNLTIMIMRQDKMKKKDLISSEITTMLSQLRSPSNYFAGAKGWFKDSPDNILVFHREKYAESVTDHGIQMHPRFVLCFYLEPALISVDGQTFSLKKDSGLLLFPFQQTMYPKIGYERINWVFVTFELSDSEALQRFRNTPFPLSEPIIRRLQDVIQVFVAHRQGRHLEAGGIRAHTSLLLGELLMSDANKKPSPRQSVHSPVSGDSKLVQKCVRHIYAHLDQPLQIDDLARSLHISASHLSRTFRKNMGTSLGKFMTQVRTTHAASLLCTTDLQISEVAPRCGYDSLYAFSRSFKQTTGFAPSLYREQMRNLLPETKT